MVSGPLVGDEASNKAYSRKNQSYSKNPNHVLHHSSPPQNMTQVRGALASNDSSSDNGSLPGHAEPDNGPRGYSKFGNMVRIQLDSWSKADLREIKWKLMSELEQVRCLVKNLEAKEAELSERYVQSQFTADDVIDNVKTKTTMRVNSEVGSVGLRDSGPYRGLSVSGAEDDGGAGQYMEKQKRTWKANQCSRNSEFPIGKEKLPPLGSSKKLKSNGRTIDEGGVGPWFRKGKNPSPLFKSCSTLLDKLIKHKFGWVFKKPVDVKALGLHDYNKIIKKPMDLGTVKTRLNENWYKTPVEFAEEVRLTFNNAMLYNPKEQDAHLMAEQLLKMFEDQWAALEAEYNLNRRNEIGNDSNLPPPVSRKIQAPAAAPLPLEMRTLDRAESTTKPVNPKLKPVSSGHTGRPPVPKKPKARDPNKRDMTYAEKQRLSTNLQTLPSEKLDTIVQIIKKRNLGLCQQEDEIEVDIESVDPETLWELDRFVTNYRKSLSKNKRRTELAPQSIAEPGHAIQDTNVATYTSVAEKEAKAVRREEQGDNVSGSSSSGSGSGSSSSDSDNDSSSGCGSDSNR
ncbi:PREDICTED: mRNAion factor [Prunus dulcis]|uniref:PREDICTED: mRNAion factor n=1 Tax=Prunus dulcis TaxID=3755 RepID=A0A5E4EPR9_PRUDU|nr:transcription factor GTE4-like isoform X4 [Prunus dulcis]VVA16611.1 PREDICTED: mRNAion factor [Prunus dulcis]